MPITDDYHVLMFLAHYANSHSFSEKWQLLVQPMREGGMMQVPKLYLIAVLKIFGSINFKWLILINGLVFLAIIILLFKCSLSPLVPLNNSFKGQKELL